MQVYMNHGEIQKNQYGHYVDEEKKQFKHKIQRKEINTKELKGVHKGTLRNTKKKRLTQRNSKGFTKGQKGIQRIAEDF
jgi:hypothetical protein